MTITEDQITVARSYIGLKWDEDDIGTRYDKFFTSTSGDEDLSLYYTTVEILRTQLAQMTLDRATSLSAEGLSQSFVTNLTTLRQMVKELETAGNLDIGRMVGISKFSRTDPR